METFSLETIAASVGAMERAACEFSSAGVDLVAQYGSPFSLVHGLGARPIQEQIARACGLPVVLMGVAMLDALDRLGARDVGRGILAQVEPLERAARSESIRKAGERRVVLNEESLQGRRPRR